MIEERKIIDAAYICLCAIASNYLMVRMAQEKIGDPFSLKSRTPNGRLTDIYPEVKNVINEVLKPILQNAAYIEDDFNLRIKGNESEEENNRPYSTSKWHTDIWTGEPLNSKALIIPIIGNIDGAGLDFGYSDNLPLQEFTDYAEGLKKCGLVQRIEQPMRLGYAYTMLATCLHRTKTASGDFRMSLDIRFTNEVPQASSRSDKYIPIKDWLSDNGK